jgi:hypothetical protein
MAEQSVRFNIILSSTILYCKNCFEILYGYMLLNTNVAQSYILPEGKMETILCYSNLYYTEMIITSYSLESICYINKSCQRLVSSTGSRTKLSAINEGACYTTLIISLSMWIHLSTFQWNIYLLFSITYYTADNRYLYTF